MVFKKQANPQGNYIEKDKTYIDEHGQEIVIPGVVRYDILSCEICESKEWYDTGEVDEDGNPIWDWRIVINKGWDAFDSEAEAAEAYNLRFDPVVKAVV